MKLDHLISQLCEKLALGSPTPGAQGDYTLRFDDVRTDFSPAPEPDFGLIRAYLGPIDITKTSVLRGLLKENLPTGDGGRRVIALDSQDDAFIAYMTQRIHLPSMTYPAFETALERLLDHAHRVLGRIGSHTPSH